MPKCARRWRETQIPFCRSAPTVGTRVTVTIAPFKKKPRFRPLPTSGMIVLGSPRATAESGRAIVAAADLYRDIPGYKLTHRPRRLRFPDVTHGWHCRSSHCHVRDLVHGRRGGTGQRVVAAFSGRALAQPCTRGVLLRFSQSETGSHFPPTGSGVLDRPIA